MKCQLPLVFLMKWLCYNSHSPNQLLACCPLNHNHVNAIALMIQKVALLALFMLIEGLILPVLPCIHLEQALSKTFLLVGTPLYNLAQVLLNLVSLSELGSMIMNVGPFVDHPRMSLSFFTDVHQWRHDVLRAWHDLIYPTVALDFILVAPDPTDEDPRIAGHLILLQRPMDHACSVLPSGMACRDVGLYAPLQIRLAMSVLP